MLFYRYFFNSGLWSDSFILGKSESKVKALGVGAWWRNQGQRNQAFLMLKGKQYEYFLLEQQGEPELCLGKD